MYQGFLREPGGKIRRIHPKGATYTDVESINDGGVVTGFYSGTKNVYHGFVRAADGTVTTFDPPGAFTGPYPTSAGQENAVTINPEGTIAGWYSDTSNVTHAFVRDKNGVITTIDAPGAGTLAGQGTVSGGINPKGVITGSYIDANSVNYGFVRDKNGVIATVDTPGAGTSAGQGTSPIGINSPGVTTGWYADGNNVNLDREARLLSENQMRFNLASVLVRGRLKSVQEAITGGGSQS